MAGRTFAALIVICSLFAQGADAFNDRLPDGGIVEQDGIRAFYAGPTDRYPHGILGDSIEASSLVVQMNDTTLRYDLPTDSVFEDLTPRLVDADGDGKLDVLTIRSYLSYGATIALFRISDDGLHLAAEATPIGIPNRWLNPAGVSDYDGDGKPEIAVVQTPHIGGILILYSWDGKNPQIAEERRIPGFSTHAIGSRSLGLAVSEDWDGDGITDLILPRQNRTELVALSMAENSFQEIDDYNMRREIVGDLHIVGDFLIVPLRGGMNRTVTRPYSPQEKKTKK